jgi:hypothetical protein
MKKIVILVILILLGSLVYFYYIRNNGTLGGVSSQSQYDPNGWIIYRNNEWGIQFSYPPSWKFNVIHHPNSDVVYGFTLQDGCDENDQSKQCDYDIFIGKSGSGIRSANWTNPSYIIDGKTAKTWQTERAARDDGYEQIITVVGFMFHIHTPDKTKEISDSFLSTVRFVDMPYE